MDSHVQRLQRSLQENDMEPKTTIDLNTIQLNDIEPVFACGVIPYPTDKAEVNEVTDLCLRFFHRRQHAEETLEMYYHGLLNLYALVPDDLKCEEDLIKVFIVGIYSKPIIISFQIMESAHFPRNYDEVLHLSLQYDYFIREEHQLRIPNVPEEDPDVDYYYPDDFYPNEEGYYYHNLEVERGRQVDENANQVIERRKEEPNQSQESHFDQNEQDKSSPVYFIESIYDMQSVSENVIIDGTLNQSYAQQSRSQRNCVEVPMSREQELEVEDSEMSEEYISSMESFCTEEEHERLMSIRSVRRRLF
ncbi:uncharacterized protein [Lepeophtheirus salmonis]|uniref:uncharacterized protein n=1 Tax=Lepeophtheirus salmonis TaxID=72036 RepID=UPI001AE1FB12|nr:uncharacterized protein LOC121118562 [Lepeophtheirus salmonis]